MSENGEPDDGARDTFLGEDMTTMKTATQYTYKLMKSPVGTLRLVEPDAVIYVKTCVIDGTLAVTDDHFGLGYFLLGVEDVVEDAAAEWESGLRITSAIEYRPVPALDAPWVRATLAALAAPRARV